MNFRAMQAIRTRYAGPVRLIGSRIHATAAGRRLSIPYDCALSSDENHARAARKLADRLGWGGEWIAGAIDSGRRVYVRAEVAP